MGEIPLMVLSKNCLLENNQNHLEDMKEDSFEVGGFFIVNGLEKILRNIIIPKKNYPMAVERSAFSNRMKSFTHNAVMIKSVKPSYLS